MPQQEPQRNLPDRRRRPTPLISSYAFFGRGRRHGFRRDEEEQNRFVIDRYDWNSVALVLIGLILCIADAFFTLQLVQKGAREINPIMNFLLLRNPMLFLVVKYALTGVSMLLLLFLRNRRLWGTPLRGRHLLALVPLFYSLVILWELLLNWRMS